jgi:hypothetical protein
MRSIEERGVVVRRDFQVHVHLDKAVELSSRELDSSSTRLKEACVSALMRCGRTRNRARWLALLLNSMQASITDIMTVLVRIVWMGRSGAVSACL